MRKYNLITNDKLFAVTNHEGKALVHFRNLNVFEDFYSDIIFGIVKDYQKNIAKSGVAIPEISPSDFFDHQRVPDEIHCENYPYHWLASGSYQGGVEITLRKIPIIWSYDKKLAFLIMNCLKDLFRLTAKKQGIQAKSIEFEIFSMGVLASMFVPTS